VAPFFPRETLEWHIHEPAPVRRFSLSLVGMALLTGVTIRLYRLLVLAYGGGVWFLFGSIAIGLTILLGLATTHLGNYPVRHWLWRAPLFGAVEAIAEAATSALLIALGLERTGTAHADWHDWPSMLAETLLGRVLLVSAFAALLAGVVQVVRYALLKREHRESTAAAIHEDHQRHHAPPR
jgi:hypothetical protein